MIVQFLVNGITIYRVDHPNAKEVNISVSDEMVKDRIGRYLRLSDEMTIRVMED